MTLPPNEAPTASGEGSPPVEPSIPSWAKWCQPGDMQDKRYFIVKFEDQDRSDALFTDEAEAREFYARATVSWNCWLFGALPAFPEPTVSGEGELVEQLLNCTHNAVVLEICTKAASALTAANADRDRLARELEKARVEIAAAEQRGREEAAKIAVAEIQRSAAILRPDELALTVDSAIRRPPPTGSVVSFDGTVSGEPTDWQVVPRPEGSS